MSGQDSTGSRTPSTSGPALRLVRPDDLAPGRSPSPRWKAAAPAEDPQPAVLSAADPRWVLAVRAAEALQGTALDPVRRASLVRMGQAFGLTVFDCNLILAIVQDQARRGIPPARCASSGARQLAMVTPPQASAERSTSSVWWRAAAISVALLAAQLALLAYLLS